MFKTIRLTLVAAVAFSATLTFTPMANAAINADLYKSLLKKIYVKSDEGDAGDIRRIISDAIDKHDGDDLELVKKLIATLKKNRNRLHEFVSNDDLESILKKLRKKIARQRAWENANGGTQGPVTGSESPVVNP